MAFMFGDLLNPYWWMLVAPTILLTIWAQWKVKSTFEKYSRIPSRSGVRGADAAAAVMRAAQVEGVKIERGHGYLTDHYHPLKKSLVLSEPVYDSSSIAALGVAAHEAGHAIQHRANYLPMFLRSAWVPVASIGSMIAPYAILIGTILGGFTQDAPPWARTIVLAGIWLFAAVALCTVVTLPVEFNASSRAVAILRQSGIVTNDEEERGVRAVLNAAAMTYVASAAATVMNLIYLIIRYNSSRSRE